jgi:hypothetical protein
MLMTPPEEKRFPFFLPLHHCRLNRKSKDVLVLCPSHLERARRDGPVLLTGQVSLLAECNHCKQEREGSTPCETRPFLVPA